MRWFVYCTIAALCCATGAAYAQLPPDAVDLSRVKISEQQKSHQLCPVHLVEADPAIPTWTHDGVTYGGDTAECQALFEKSPDEIAAKAKEGRWKNNFMKAMSPIWCPVTDEISAGGNIQWEVLGYTWESCCQFCNDTKSDEDFPRAVKRLKKRADEAYKLTGAKYTEGASSPVQGAIDLGGGFPDEEEHDHDAHDHGAHDHDAHDQGPSEPAWLEGVDLKPTFAGGVGLIFENRCVMCHRIGGAAPMSFVRYGEIRKWSKNMKERLQNRTMPPWPADDRQSKAFSTSQRLTQRELDLLLEWAGSGMPPGDGAYTPGHDWKSEWVIGEPSHVFDLEEYTLPEDVAEEVKEFKIKTDFPEDRWVVASEVKPTDTFLVLEVDAGPLGSYHQGKNNQTLPDGAGYLLKKGQEVTVRVFYTKEEGWEEYDDSTQIGVIFAEDPSSVTRRILNDRMANDSFTIAPGDGQAKVSSSFTFPADGKIESLVPVMRERGKSLSYTAVLPDGSETTLLTIPHWDMMWHFRYTLEEPFDAPKGTVVRLDAVYDNSDMNAANPDATATVTAGPNGEVLEGWLAYSLN